MPKPETFEEFTKVVARLRMDDELTEEEQDADSTSDILNELIATARKITGIQPPFRER